MHMHSVWGTILSDVFFEAGFIEIEGYEMKKALAGVVTHEQREIVPILFARQKKTWGQESTHVFLLSA